jgi:hypothetical protein
VAPAACRPPARYRPVMQLIGRDLNRAAVAGPNCLTG